MNIAIQCGNEFVILGSLPIKFPKNMPYLKFHVTHDSKSKCLAKDIMADSLKLEAKQYPIQEGTLTVTIPSIQSDIHFKFEHIIGNSIVIWQKYYGAILFEIEAHEEVVREGRLIILDTSGDLDLFIQIGMIPCCELDWDQ